MRSTIQTLTEGQREMLIAASGVDALDAALHRIIDVGVDGIRPKAQAFELLRVLEDAEQRWVLDGEELSRCAKSRSKVEATLSLSGGTCSEPHSKIESEACRVRDQNRGKPDRR